MRTFYRIAFAMALSGGLLLSSSRADDAADLRRLRDLATIGGVSINEGSRDHRNTVGTGSVKSWITHPETLHVAPRNHTVLYEGNIVYHFSGRERVADYVLGVQRRTMDHQTSGRITAAYEITRSGTVLIVRVRRVGGRGRVGDAIMSHLTRLSGRNLRTEMTGSEPAFSDAFMVASVAEILESLGNPESGVGSRAETSDTPANDVMSRQRAERIGFSAARILESDPRIESLNETLDSESLGIIVQLLRSAHDELNESNEHVIAAAVSRFASRLRSLNSEIGSDAPVPERTIDFRNSEPARRAASMLKGFAQGNERSAGWEELSLNTSNGDFRGRAYIRSRHVIKVRIPFDGKKKVTVYDWKVTGSVTGNIKTGQGDGDVNFGRGIRVSVRDIVRLLSGAEVSPGTSDPGHDTFEADGYRLRWEKQPERLRKLRSLGQGPSQAGRKPAHVPEAASQDWADVPPIETFFFDPPQTVCPPDERDRVTATTKFPHSAMCQLLITLPGGIRARGTGWLMGPRLVVTAGHCVHEGKGGGYFESVEVVPAMNESDRPFGSQTARRAALRAAQSWTVDGSVAGDYGAIILERPFIDTMGRQPVYLEPIVLPDEQLAGAVLELSGYPGDKPIGHLYGDEDPVHRLTSDRISYLLDTAGGQSGGAVRLHDTNRVVGIHNYGPCPNKCTRITDDVLGRLDSWLAETRDRD